MSILLKSILVWALSSFFLKLTIALGISVFSYTFLTDLADNAVSKIQYAFDGLPPAVMQVLSIASVPEAISIFCSALIVVTTIKALKISVGLS